MHHQGSEVLETHKPVHGVKPGMGFFFAERRKNRT
jgi:hypothetical protein